jgi:hypothetical protein
VLLLLLLLASVANPLRTRLHLVRQYNCLTTSPMSPADLPQ